MLAPKLVNFWKHNGRRKALVVILGVYKVGKFYMKKNSVHAKNEHLYANVKKEIIANQVFCGVIAKREKNLCSFVVCFHMVSKGRL